MKVDNSKKNQTVVRVFCGLLLSVILDTAIAETNLTISKARVNPESSQQINAAIKSPENIEVEDALQIDPLVPQTGVSVLLVYPKRFSAQAKICTTTVSKIHAQLKDLFGESPKFAISIRLLDEELFFKTTGAPRWTNALYYKKQILLPLSLTNETNLLELERSLRHEYTHAVIHAHSGGKAPGWIDEGIAQWLEGVEHPGLRPALFDWLNNNKPVELLKLQTGFTKLPPDMVPAAYAQSLFAAKLLIGTFSSESLREYFESLRANLGKAESFRLAFGMRESDFEASLDTQLKAWQLSASAKIVHTSAH